MISTAKWKYVALSIILAIAWYLLMPAIPAFANEPELLAGQNALATQAGDNVTTAEWVELNTWTSNQLSSDDDEDWYRISLTQPGRLDLKFKGDYASSDRWYFSLRNANNDELWEGSFEASENLEGRVVTLHTTGLPAGTFYIEVYGYYSDQLVNKDYAFYPQFTASDAWETELNDTVVTYDSIPLNKGVNGTLSSDDDEDWYRISLTQPGRLDLKFKGDYASSDRWYFSLRNANNDELWEGSFEASENLEGRVVTLHTTGLPAGTFYIEVYGYYSDQLVNKVYNLTPAFTASDAWETELNDTVVTYDSIKLGKAVHGTLRDEDEQDWFRVDLPKAGRLQLKFSGEYAAGDYWYLSLRNANNDELWDGQYEGTTRTTKTLCSQQLKAGTYYVQVYGSYSDRLVNKEYILTPSYSDVSSTSITKLARGSKSFKASWMKVSDASNYQLRYSTKSSMKKATIVNVSKSLGTKKVTKLKAKKLYYVQVRVAKTVAGTTYYSTWSAKKSVKTK